MIKYKLICKNCDLSFDSWFASSQEYEKLKKKNFLNCHNCNSKKIEKTLMAPLINKSLEKKHHQNKLKFNEDEIKLKELIPKIDDINNQDQYIDCLIENTKKYIEINSDYRS